MSLVVHCAVSTVNRRAVKFLKLIDAVVHADLTCTWSVTITPPQDAEIAKWLLRTPLHRSTEPHQLLLDELVERWFAELTGVSCALRTPQRHRTRSRHPQMDQHMERRPQTVSLNKTAAKYSAPRAYCERINASALGHSRSTSQRRHRALH